MKHELSLLLCGLLALAATDCGGDSNSSDGNTSSNSSGGTGAGSSDAAGSSAAAATSATPSNAAASAVSDTWDSYGQGFFVSYCVSCHNDDNSGDATRDFHQRGVVDAQSSEIACGVSKSTAEWSARGCTGFPPARQFPIGNGAHPSDADRDRLVAWIDAGLP